MIRRTKNVLVVVVALGLAGGLQGVAVARHDPGGPPVTPPGHGGVPPGHGGVPPGLASTPPGHAGAHANPAPSTPAHSRPGHHAGAHGHHQAAAGAGQGHGSGHPGHSHGHAKVSATPAATSLQSSAQPSSAARSPRIARSIGTLAQTSLGTTPLIVRGLGSALSQPISTRLIGSGLKPLSRAGLRALVSGAQPLEQHGFGQHGVAKGDPGSKSAAPRAPVVGIRPADPPAPSVIQDVEHVVPLGVWIALAAALALAATGGVATAVTGRRSRRQAARLAAVSAQALTDPLTGVLNRRGFLDALDRELARARRYDRPVALAYVDVRGLKAVNDSEGHLAGDELLREAAGMLEDSARADDVVGRIGGDELALLLGEQSIEGATVVANRIRDQVPARRAMLRLREPWDLTIGTASYPADGTTVDELLAAADRRLYEQRGIAIR